MVKENEYRKEVHLTKAVIDALAKQANKENRSLKNYMEIVLIEHSQNKATCKNLKKIN